MILTITIPEKEKYLVTLTSKNEMLDQEMVIKRKYLGDDYFVNHLSEDKINVIYLK
jgi:hypothetical protein